MISITADRKAKKTSTSVKGNPVEIGTEMAMAINSVYNGMLEQNVNAAEIFRRCIEFAVETGRVWDLIPVPSIPVQ